MERVKTKRGMTLIEILLVTSLVAMMGGAIYHTLSGGLKVWACAERLVIEQDIVILFEKITCDLHNTFTYSQLSFKGSPSRFSFPTMVITSADARSGLSDQEYVEQIGVVEYFFDPFESALCRRQANYSQALHGRFGKARTIVSSIKRLKFRYYYLSENRKEVTSNQTLEVLPSRVEVEVEFLDRKGQRRSMKKSIDLYRSAEGVS